MKKISLVVGLLSILFILTFNELKADYLDDALQRCVRKCDQIFTWPISEVCRAGCYIGIEIRR